MRWMLAVLMLGAARAEEARPNILLLYADDWRHDTLGCAGNPVVKTPHLDALAKEGLRFTRACVTTSICGVSRSSLLTGQWMSRHGNRGFDMFKTPWEQTYPALLRESGYWTGHVGKWHNGKFPAGRFDFGRAYDGRHWLMQPGGSQVHVTRKNQDDALEFLKGRPKDKPFCLTVAFFATHAEDANPQQYLPQPESMSLYENVKIPVPATATDEAMRRLPPFLQAPSNEGRVRWKWRFDTPEKYQAMMKNYYRMATEVDAVCGRVLDELKAEGELDRTIVVFTTDNGYFHGEHGLADKWYPYEESIRVPLIVRDARIPAERRGMTDEHFVLNVDLAPMFLDAAGAKVPQTMQGKDFSALYRGDAREWREAFYYEHPTITNKERIPSSQAWVTKDAKFIRWPEFGYEEFFDLKKDPGEMENRIRDESRKGEIEEMRLKLAEPEAAVGGG
ncbi:sulfatase family protein [Luteolibacter luteus]|uniref:Sulfatase n=1 Tax=Luteolibacter luteus TaxID=2728835 RepID=A0A858RFC0_9BACT|nr:sulfatase [Luteolibacter luteus]QJE95301.1 sulfatase [Luteolibacter luteus]